MNKVFLVGRLAGDPEEKTTTTGTKMSKVSIAVQNSGAKKETYFFPCVAFQNSATFLNTYLHKGDMVAVDGKLTRREYTNEAGAKSSITEIIIDSINSIGGSNSKGKDDFAEKTPFKTSAVETNDSDNITD
jgi:single-strand DNA-binding protein